MSNTISAPAHPADILRESLEALELSVAKAAAALGVSRSALNRVLSKDSAISPEMAARLEKVIGSTAETWLALQNRIDLDAIRAEKADKLNSLARYETV